MPIGSVNGQRVLRLPQVRKVTGLSRSAVYRLEAENRFPRRINISARAVGWLENEVQAWLTKRIESSRDTLAMPNDKPQADCLTEKDVERMEELVQHGANDAWRERKAIEHLIAEVRRLWQQRSKQHSW